VRDATLDTTAALVAEHGLASVTMSQIAEQTGIGRATLYKYFPDVEAILVAWHERQITAHLAQLAEVRDQAGDAGQRLQAVLEAYALISMTASPTSTPARRSPPCCIGGRTSPTRSGRSMT
jgi:AcrR family transcriptional regulator